MKEAGSRPRNWMDGSGQGNELKPGMTAKESLKSCSQKIL